ERAFAEPGMCRQPKIIVGGQIDDGAVVEGGVGLLFVIEHSQSAVQPLGFETVQLVGEIPQRIGPHHRILCGHAYGSASNTSAPSRNSSVAPRPRSVAVVSRPSASRYAASCTITCVTPSSRIVSMETSG